VTTSSPATTCTAGTHRILTQVYEQYDLETTFVDTTDHDAVRDAMREETELVWVETPTNPC